MRTKQSIATPKPAMLHRVILHPANKPRLAVRVGVTGHRALDPGELSRIESQISEVLKRIAGIAYEIHERRDETFFSVFSDAKPALRLISPLAEGADQLAAEQAIRNGFEIQSPLPFTREEYENDFQGADQTAGSKVAEFRRLLAQANGYILELDGSRAAEGHAYEAVGRIVLRQCDVLIAVWSPEHDGGVEKTGGTRQIIREAIDLEIPTIWISAGKRADPCLLLSVEPPRTEEISRLQHHLEATLLPLLDQDTPDMAASAKEVGIMTEIGEADTEDDFLTEEAPPDDFSTPKYGNVYLRFRDFWCWDWEEIPSGPEPDWSPILAENRRLVETFQEKYQWADKLANFYGGIYRSSYVATYLMGAFAIFFAFLGFYSGNLFPEDHPWHGLPLAFYAIELVLLGVISTLTFGGKIRNWHRRWLDYRILAENFRQILFLAPIGRTNPSVNIPEHLQPTDTWSKKINWYFLTQVREAGMAKGKFDNAYLSLYKVNLAKTIEGQIAYHKNNSGRHELLSRRIRVTSYCLFILAAISCLTHFIPGHEDYLGITLALNLFTIVLPAFGAALGAIAHQGEFEKVATQSKATEEQLSSLKLKLETSPETSDELSQIAEKFSEISIGELLVWRFAFLHKSLEPS